MREGNKKTIFANVSDICKRMHRQPEHVIQYMFAEMGTTGSVDGSGRLVIKGRFQQKQVEHVLRRYIGMLLKVFYRFLLICQLIILTYRSRVRHLQDVQVAGHAPHEGEPYILHGVRVVRIPAVRQHHQDRLPGAGWEEKQKQDWVNGRVPRLVYAVWIRLDTALYHTHAVYTIETTCIALILCFCEGTVRVSMRPACRPVYSYA